jgi:hypothetical protein
MSTKTKVWLLVGVVAALAVGVTLRIERHRDESAKEPAAQASAPQKQEHGAPAATTAVPQDAIGRIRGVPGASGAPAEAAEAPEEHEVGKLVGAAAGGPKTAALRQARGTVVSQTKHKLVILAEGDSSLEFDLPETKEMTRAFAKGERVAVEYVEIGGRKIAKHVRREEGRSAGSPG